MNKKEVGEIRRRFKLERNNISHIFGCYVNSAKEIVSYIDESVAMLTQEETEKYLSLLRKSLSGTLGRNLMSLSFATKQVMDSDEVRLLSALRKSELSDAALRDAETRLGLVQRFAAQRTAAAALEDTLTKLRDCVGGDARPLAEQALRQLQDLKG